MQLISYPTENFKVASERTEGIPSQAIEIEGKIVEIGKQNLAKWGIKSSAVNEIIDNSIGMPVRMCNDRNPHACDYKHDHSADIGYVTKIWQEGNWLKAAAAITDKTASEKLKDGTWLPFGNGEWSITGYLTGSIDDNGMLDQYFPAAISFVLPPNRPAYEGSKFEIVAAAVWSTAFINSLPDSSFAFIESCYGKTTDNKNARHLPFKDEDGNVDIIHLRNALARVGQIKPVCPDDTKNRTVIIERTKEKLELILNKQKLKGASMTDKEDVIDPIDSKKTDETDDTKDVKKELKTDDKIPKKDEVVMYDQEAFDKKLTEALKTQKLEYEKQMATMTPQDDLKEMFVAAKKEAVKTTLDQINREKLASDYMEMLTASKVLSAPYMTDDKVDNAKLKAKSIQIEQLSASVINDMITETKMMVAAMPAGNTAFNDANVNNKSPNTGYDFAAVEKEFKGKLGVK